MVVDCRPVPVEAPTLIDASTLAERLAPYTVPSNGFVLLWMEGALLAQDDEIDEQGNDDDGGERRPQPQGRNGMHDEDLSEVKLLAV